MMFFLERRRSCCCEIEDYIRACQHLLHAMSLLHRRALTNDEAHLVEHHRQELIKVIGTGVGRKTEEFELR